MTNTTAGATETLQTITMERVVEASRNWGLAGSPTHTFAPFLANASHYCQHCGSGRLGWQHN